MSYLKKYEYVIAVAKCGGISQAAELIGVSQPTFSKYLKKIESELGAELFDRSTLPLRLTPAGECFCEAGKRLIDIDRQLLKQLNEIKSNENAVVRVGTSPSRSPYIMPDILALYRKKNPSARVVVEERTTKELNSRLATGELDLIISLLDKDTESFDRIELFDENVYVAVSGECVYGSDTAEDVLKNSTLISVGHGQVMWQTLNSILSELNLPEPEIECQSIESALALTKRGLGAMIVPSYVARRDDGCLKFLPIRLKNEQAYKRRVCIFFRKEQFLTSAERDFIDCVIETEKDREEV